MVLLSLQGNMSQSVPLTGNDQVEDAPHRHYFSSAQQQRTSDPIRYVAEHLQAFHDTQAQNKEAFAKQGAIIRPSKLPISRQAVNAETKTPEKKDEEQWAQSFAADLPAAAYSKAEQLQGANDTEAAQNDSYANPSRQQNRDSIECAAFGQQSTKDNDNNIGGRQTTVSRQLDHDSHIHRPNIAQDLLESHLRYVRQISPVRDLIPLGALALATPAHSYQHGSDDFDYSLSSYRDSSIVRYTETLKSPIHGSPASPFPARDSVPMIIIAPQPCPGREERADNKKTVQPDIYPDMLPPSPAPHSLPCSPTPLAIPPPDLRSRGPTTPDSSSSSTLQDYTTNLASAIHSTLTTILATASDLPAWRRNHNTPTRRRQQLHRWFGLYKTWENETVFSEEDKREWRRCLVLLTLELGMALKKGAVGKDGVGSMGDRRRVGIDKRVFKNRKGWFEEFEVGKGLE